MMYIVIPDLLDFVFPLTSEINKFVTNKIVLDKIPYSCPVFHNTIIAVMFSHDVMYMDMYKSEWTQCHSKYGFLISRSLDF